jgi:hypothetical protein
MEAVDWRKDMIRIEKRKERSSALWTGSKSQAGDRSCWHLVILYHYLFSYLILGISYDFGMFFQYVGNPTKEEEEEVFFLCALLRQMLTCKIREMRPNSSLTIREESSRFVNFKRRERCVPNLWLPEVMAFYSINITIRHASIITCGPFIELILVFLTF